MAWWNISILKGPSGTALDPQGLNVIRQRVQRGQKHFWVWLKTARFLGGQGSPVGSYLWNIIPFWENIGIPDPKDTLVKDCLGP